MNVLRMKKKEKKRSVILDLREFFFPKKNGLVVLSVKNQYPKKFPS